MRRILLVALCLACGCTRSTGGGGPPNTAGPPNNEWPSNDGGSNTPPDGVGDPVARTWPPAGRMPNPIPAENQLPGDPDWMSHVQSSWNHQLEGYTNRVSGSAGDAVQVMVSSDTPHSATWSLYRLGWYGGAGARKVMDGGTVQVSKQPDCPHTSTGLVRCSWTPTIQFTIPADAVSGLYLVRVVRDDKFAIYPELVVRDERTADILFASGISTHEAYNTFGGESLYQDMYDHVYGGFALSVSFDRPYLGWGAGQVLRYEQRMARYLERYGYDVTYTTSMDISREGAAALLKRGVYFHVGHDEYWSGELRDAIEQARDSGVHEFWFAGNPAYWKCRYSDPGPEGTMRTITVYKKHPDLDPLAGTPDRTGRWRDPAIHRSEEALLGVMYESWMLFGFPWVVQNASHPFYAGTGLAEGDVIPMLVGYEYDRTFEKSTPAPATLLAHSPIVDAEGHPSWQEATYFTHPSGAIVFAAGSIYWSLFVDGPQRDPRVERMVANLLNIALGLPVPAALQNVVAPAVAQPDPAWASSVSTFAGGMNGPAGLARMPDGSFVVADARAHRIWQVSAGGAVTAYAGDGNESGSTRYDNVPGLQARFFQPTSVLADAAGNVYVADTHNSVIRKIANDAVHTVTSVAGVFLAAGFADGIGTAARLSAPMGMDWLDATHILFADSGNQAIRVLDVTSGAVSTLAGANYGDETDGPAAQAVFFFPTAVAKAPDGRIFFVASSTGRVKVIGTDPARTVTTLIDGAQGFVDGVGNFGATLGYADGPGNVALMLPQGGIVWDGSALLVSDAGNHRIRRVVPGADPASTRVQTWAGNGKPGAANGAGSAASLSVPLGLWRAPDGTVYVSDSGNGSIRAVRP